MFSFFTPKTIVRAGELLQVDMHAHILPGIDDGAADVEASLQLIDGLIDLGYQKLIATPHILLDYYPNSPETIKMAKKRLQWVMDERGYKIPVLYAAEYMLDEYFISLMEQGELLSFGNSYVLVETMFVEAPHHMLNTLSDLHQRNYQPVLAHPERYHYVDKGLSRLLSLKKTNCLFQTNLLSFTGYYGKKEQETALRMLDAGLIDFIGTDMHHIRHLNAAQQFSVSSKIARQLEHIAYRNKELL